jgi:hypothetical protein
MAVLSQVNEASTCWLTAAFTDKAGDPVQPTTVDYRIDSDGTEVLDWTSATPGTSVEIEITSTQNAMVSSTAVLEDRTVTVKAGFGGADYSYEEYRYLVKNLGGVT